jgi:hypothetical protein
MKPLTNATTYKFPHIEHHRVAKPDFATRRLSNNVATGFLGLVFLLSFLEASGATLPTILTPEEATKSVAKWSRSATFGFSGVGFYSNRLYAACNIGLLEIEGGRVRKAYRWRRSNPVVEGPWVDLPNGIPLAARR